MSEGYDWGAARKYALLQASATVWGSHRKDYSPHQGSEGHRIIRMESIEIAEELLREIENRELARMEMEKLND